MNVNQPNARCEHTMPAVHSALLAVVALTIITWALGGTPAYGVPPSGPEEQKDSRALIHQSAQATELAWEEFHAAAIGGTLASPAIQSSIERQLHQARALLMEARKADRAQQFAEVKSLTQQILEITQNIVQASREKKQ